MHTIYITINNITGERYIGQHKTNDLNDGYLGSGKLLKENINKYGKENFDHIILEIVDNRKDADILEVEYISLYEPELNLTDGGDGGWEYVNKKKPYLKSKKWEEARKKNWEKAIQRSNWLKRNDKEWMRKLTENVAKTQKKNGTYGKAFRDLCKKFNGTQKQREIARKTALKYHTFQGKNNPSYGKKWVYNDNESIRVNKNEVDKYLENGYKLGRKMKT